MSETEVQDEYSAALCVSRMNHLSGLEAVIAATIKRSHFLAWQARAVGNDAAYADLLGLSNRLRRALDPSLPPVPPPPASGGAKPDS